MKRAVSLLLLLAFFSVSYAKEGNVVQEGKLRITVLTSRMLRIQFGEDFNDISGLSGPNGLRDPNDLSDPKDLSARRNDDYLFLETGALTLRYQLGGEILPNETNDQVLRISFRMNNRTVIWYPGKDDALNLNALPANARLSEMTEADRSSLPKGLLSRAGWSVIDLQSQSQKIDWLFLGYGHDYEGALKDYRSLQDSLGMEEKRLVEDYSCPRSERVDQGLAMQWSNLAFAPYLAATAANGATICYSRRWDEDVRPQQTNQECYVRWMQLAAFMPARETATPDSVILPRLQTFDHADALTQAFELQRAMRHYADSVLALGYSLCRPLYYAFPEENNAYIYEDEFLFGTDILVAPITRSVQKDGLARRVVWLPPGRWWDVVGRRWQEGPQLLTGEYTLRETPVFWSEPYAQSKLLNTKTRTK